MTDKDLAKLIEYVEAGEKENVNLENVYDLFSNVYTNLNEWDQETKIGASVRDRIRVANETLKRLHDAIATDLGHLNDYYNEQKNNNSVTL